MFELTSKEMDFLVSHFVIPSHKSFGGAKALVFTEQGVAMLSSVLRSEMATKISIQIMRAFVEMRKIINTNKKVLDHIELIEKRFFQYAQESDKRFEILFQGQIFDAYKLVSDIVRSAEKSIVLIDNYVDDTVSVFPEWMPE